MPDIQTVQYTKEDLISLELERQEVRAHLSNLHRKFNRAKHSYAKTIAKYKIGEHVKLRDGKKYLVSEVELGDAFTAVVYHVHQWSHLSQSFHISGKIVNERDIKGVWE